MNAFSLTPSLSRWERVNRSPSCLKCKQRIRVGFRQNTPGKRTRRARSVAIANLELAGSGDRRSAEI